MRRRFFELLYEFLKRNPHAIALTGDLGYGGFDRIKKELSGQFLNCGASEQAMIDISIGLSYRGAIPIVYSITPFLLYRPFESIRTYINHEAIPIKMIGSGRARDYEHDGFSHFASDQTVFLDSFPNIQSYYPSSTAEMEETLFGLLESRNPVYINLTRKV